MCVLGLWQLSLSQLPSFLIFCCFWQKLRCLQLHTKNRPNSRNFLPFFYSPSSLAFLFSSSEPFFLFAKAVEEGSRQNNREKGGTDGDDGSKIRKGKYGKQGKALPPSLFVSVYSEGGGDCSGDSSRKSGGEEGRSLGTLQITRVSREKKRKDII